MKRARGLLFWIGLEMVACSSGENPGTSGTSSTSAGGGGAGTGGASTTSGATTSGGSSCCAGSSGAVCVGQGFSAELDPYPMQPTAQSRSVDEIDDATRAPSANLSAGDAAVRRQVIQMFKDFGVDVSLDQASLQVIRPAHWSKTTPQPLDGEYRQPYSIDASFYHPIPCDTPRVELPAGYFDSVQVNAVHGFDNLGYGVAVSGSSDPIRTLTAGCCGAGKMQSFHIRDDADTLYGKNGDYAISLVDDTMKGVVHVYQFGKASDGMNWKGARATAMQILPNLGDVEGTIAAGFSDMALLIRPGEATDATHPIPHAIAIGVNRLWNAKVYPAQTVDAWVAANDTGVARLDGLIPYGGVVQLDPALDLESLGLSLPARRILEAVQRYGAYMMNTTGTSFNVYTNCDAAEFDPFGGIYQPTTHQGVQDQVLSVLKTAHLYVVPPIVKR